MSHHWGTYLAWLQSEVDAAIVAHYDATIKVQTAREKLRAAQLLRAASFAQKESAKQRKKMRQNTGPL